MSDDRTTSEKAKEAYNARARAYREAALAYLDRHKARPLRIVRE